MTTPARFPRVGVGLFLCRGSRCLFLRRRGPHGAGTWGLVGGHLEHGETPEAGAVRECLEEVGVRLSADAVRFGPFTNNIFSDEDAHSVTLFGAAPLPAGAIPRNLEPHKVSELRWCALDPLADERPPEPLFLPVRLFLAQPWRPPF